MSDRDHDQLDAFVAHGDQVAFAAVVERHASLVFGICRRITGDREDAADAAQAVFLTLAAKAAQVRSHPCLSGWLHRVAVHVALRQRRDARRMRQVPVAGAPVASANHDLRDDLDEALARLPEKYRLPIVLHHLDGLETQQVAERLRLRPSALSMRLARGRDLLRQALERRGAPVGAASFAAVLAPLALDGWTPAHVAAVIKVAGGIASGDAAVAALVSKQSLSLMHHAVKAMFIAKAKLAAALVVAVIAIGAGSAATVRAASSSVPVRGGLPLAVSRSLIGWWSFDDDAPIGQDRSGRGHQAELAGDPARVPGRHGQALSFDAIDDRMAVPALSGPGFPAAGTLALWVKVARYDPNPDHTTMIFDDWANRNHILIVLDDREKRIVVRFARSDAVASSAAAAWSEPIREGEWRHIAVVWDAPRDTGSVYLDGVLIGTQAIAGGGWRPDQQLVQFGSSESQTSQLSGCLDEIMLCDRPLDPADIAALASLTSSSHE